MANLAKWDPGLNHAKRPRIHPHEQNPLRPSPIPTQILLVRFPCVNQRIVDMSHRRRETKAIDLLAKLLRRLYELSADPRERHSTESIAANPEISNAKYCFYVFMIVLLTNDDGIDAPGLKALEQGMQEHEVWVVAPKVHMSDCGHQVTTRRGIRVEQTAPRRFAVEGSPADCIRLAVKELMKGTQPDWVLSGINAGGNLGVDVYMSGTVAAAREATFFGLKATAISHYRRRGCEVDWDCGRRGALRVWNHLQDQKLQPGFFWNVNLPHPEPGEPEPDLSFCALSRRPLPIQYKVDESGFQYAGVYAERDREPGSDVDLCFSGKITITAVGPVQ